MKKNLKPLAKTGTIFAAIILIVALVTGRVFLYPTAVLRTAALAFVMGAVAAELYRVLLGVGFEVNERLDASARKRVEETLARATATRGREEKTREE